MQPFNFQTTSCLKCDKRFSIMGLERLIDADLEIGSIRIISVIAPTLANFCPFCAAPIDQPDPDLEEIGRKAAKKARRQLQQNGHQVLKTGEGPRRAKKSGKLRKFGIVSDKMYGHEELIKIFGAAWRQRLKEARDSGPLKCSKEGAKFLYDGGDVINWRASLEENE